jgi:hypothetical protein
MRLLENMRRLLEAVQNDLANMNRGTVRTCLIRVAVTYVI